MATPHVAGVAALLSSMDSGAQRRAAQGAHHGQRRRAAAVGRDGDDGRPAQRVCGGERRRRRTADRCQRRACLERRRGVGVVDASALAYAPSGAINGDRKGSPWGNGGGWNDGTPDSWPDWLEVDFNGSKTIGEIDVFSVQDNYQAPVTPTQQMTFSLYGLTNFEVQYWTGTTWQDVPGGAISGNNSVWRQVTFAPLSTTKIRILVNAALNTWSRITEVEAWTARAPVNQPPSATLTAPADNSTTRRRQPIALTATASDPDAGDTIDHVTFFANGNQIGSSSTPVAGAYTFTWTNVTGRHVHPDGHRDRQSLAVRQSVERVSRHGQPAGRPNERRAGRQWRRRVRLVDVQQRLRRRPGAINGDRTGSPGAMAGDGTTAPRARGPTGWRSTSTDRRPSTKSTCFQCRTTTSPDRADVADDLRPVWADQLRSAVPGLVRRSQDVPGGAITGNNLVWRQVLFGSAHDHEDSHPRQRRTEHLEPHRRGRGMDHVRSRQSSPPSATLTGPPNNAVFSEPRRSR